MKRLLAVGVVVVAALIGQRAWAALTAREAVEISAPLFPDTVRLQYQYGPNYPTDQAAREKIVDEEFYVFEQLLVSCQPNYPAITLQQPGTALTPAQLATNFQEVAKCSYKQYGAKPYNIPQLVDDVDFCGRKLGADWRLSTEADLASLDPADFQFLADTLTAAGGESLNGSAFNWSSFYFSLRIYLRAADGTLKMGDLSPAATARVSPLPRTDGGAPQDLLTGNGETVVVRCIRRTPLPTP